MFHGKPSEERALWNVFCQRFLLFCVGFGEARAAKREVLQSVI